jgi:hypothetical protein
MTINESEQKQMTTFVGQSWIDEYNQYYICVELDMEKIKQEKEQYQVLFENNPNISSIETPASDPKEISVDTFDKLQIDEIDELIEYEGPELEEHDEWRPRYASLEYRKGGSVVYRVGPRFLDTVSTFYIYGRFTNWIIG